VTPVRVSVVVTKTESKVRECPRSEEDAGVLVGTVATVEDDELLEEETEDVFGLHAGQRVSRPYLRHHAPAEKLAVGDVAQLPDGREDTIRVRE
jgi:hypothetical protein